MRKCLISGIKASFLGDLRGLGMRMGYLMMMGMGIVPMGLNIKYDDDAIGNSNSDINRKLGVNAFASLRAPPTSS